METLLTGTVFIGDHSSKVWVFPFVLLSDFFGQLAKPKLLYEFGIGP